MRKRNTMRTGFSIIGVWGICIGLIVFGSGTVRAAESLNITDLEIHTPTVAVPYYHYTAKLNLPKPDTISVKEIKINSEPERNYFLVDEGETPDPNRPKEWRRMALAYRVKDPHVKKVYSNPTLYGRMDWENGKSYEVEITLQLGDNPKNLYQGKATAAAPANGGYWDPAWKNYQSAVVTESEGIRRTREPVELTMLMYPDTIRDPAREIRVVQYDCQARTHQEIPSQVIDFHEVNMTDPPAYNAKGELLPKMMVPTRCATVLFMASAEAKSSGVYLVFYNNPDAKAPSYPSTLKVSGNSPGIVIENDFYHLKMHKMNGMLDELIIKSKPEYKFVHKKETNGAIQWNPGAYAPPRAWVHISDWEPGKYDYEREEVRGPVALIIRQWGEMPLMPELMCSIVYKFYDGLPYFTFRSTVHVRNNVTVQVIRNSEVVFARECFDEAAWWDARQGKAETRRIVDYPDLTEWIMPDDTPWIAFFDRAKDCGYAGIQMEYLNSGLTAKLRTLNPYLYITVGPWLYWTRALVYPYGSNNPQHLIKIPEGSVFLEQWAYLPFELTDDSSPFQDVENLSEVLPKPLHVHLEEPISPEMQVPEEIYIEPTKTGWEE
ncbi:MAG TPA: hypothetical protein PLQ35_01040 [bacterium]|nr:hypothetical protein [bacterium]HQL60856.1 hypothetical protein [bacterium]